MTHPKHGVAMEQKTGVRPWEAGCQIEQTVNVTRSVRR